MAKFNNSDFVAMYEGFCGAIATCEAETGRPFWHSRATRVWVSRAAYEWVDHLDQVKIEKARKQWDVPAERFWPGEEFPAMLAPIKIVPLPAVDWSGWEAFEKERAAAFAEREKKKAAEWKAGEPARRAKAERERQEQEEARAQLLARQQQIAAERAAAKTEKARRRRALRAKPAAVPAAVTPRECTLAQIVESAATGAAIPPTAAGNAVDEKMAEIVSNVVKFERKMTMESFRKAAEIPGRVIPENSIAQEGAGGTVYLYERTYRTQKGREGVSYLAKAFRPGQRKHAWHHTFNTEAARTAKVAEFMASVSEVVS